MRRLSAWPIGLALVLLSGALAAPAQAYFRDRGPLPSLGGGAGISENDITIIENLGELLPKGLVFSDANGKTFALDSLFGQGKPVILTLGYYRCPLLCTLVHEGLSKGLRASGLDLGQDYLAAAISIDPSEDPKAANTNQRQLLRSLGHERPEEWPFLLDRSGPNAPVAKRLAEAVGFKYKYDAASKQFAHNAVAFVVSPNGKISRYVYGVDFPARDLRMALVEASEGRVGTAVDRVLLTCFKYDPMSQRYTPYVLGFVRIGALLSAMALFTLLGVLWRREFTMRRRRAA